MHEGKAYNYVFDVDIEDGKPPLKLPYNVSENPYDSATKFLSDNNLPISYLESVANFIVENTKGVTLGQNAGEQPTDPDPYGTNSRYRPGDGDVSQPAKNKYLPHEEYITLTQAKFEPIQKKILSLNADLIKSGDKDFALNPSEEAILGRLTTTLSSATPGKPLDIPDEAVRLVIKLTTKWSYPNRLPGLDLIRCMAPSPSVATLSIPGVGSIVQAVLSAALESDNPTLRINDNSVMMALRAITNLFVTPQGRAVAAREAATVVAAMERIAGETPSAGGPIGATNRNVQIALTSAAFNYACLAYGQSKDGPDAAAEKVGPETLLLLCNVLGKTLREQGDGEVAYRALMALGMVLCVGGEVRRTAGALDAAGWVRGAVDRAAEGRVKDVGAECLSLLR